MENKYGSLFHEHDDYEQLTIDDDYEEWLANLEKKQLEEQTKQITTTTRSKSL